jgi:hypothetical protein
VAAEENQEIATMSLRIGSAIIVAYPHNNDQGRFGKLLREVGYSKEIDLPIWEVELFATAFYPASVTFYNQFWLRRSEEVAVSK